MTRPVHHVGHASIQFGHDNIISTYQRATFQGRYQWWVQCWRRGSLQHVSTTVNMNRAAYSDNVFGREKQSETRHQELIKRNMLAVMALPALEAAVVVIVVATAVVAEVVVVFLLLTLYLGTMTKVLPVFKVVRVTSHPVYRRHLPLCILSCLFWAKQNLQLGCERHLSMQRRCMPSGSLFANGAFVFSKYRLSHVIFERSKWTWWRYSARGKQDGGSNWHAKSQQVCELANERELKSWSLMHDKVSGCASDLFGPDARYTDMSKIH